MARGKGRRARGAKGRKGGGTKKAESPEESAPHHASPEPQAPSAPVVDAPVASASPAPVVEELIQERLPPGHFVFLPGDEIVPEFKPVDIIIEDLRSILARGRALGLQPHPNIARAMQAAGLAPPPPEESLPVPSTRSRPMAQTVGTCATGIETSAAGDEDDHHNVSINSDPGSSSDSEEDEESQGLSRKMSKTT